MRKNAISHQTFIKLFPIPDSEGTCRTFRCWKLHLQDAT